MTPALAKAITDKLKASPTVTALCGTRIYPTVAPDRVAVPYLVFTELTSVAEESHDDANGLDATQIEFACYASDTLNAIKLRQAARLVLSANGAFPGVAVTQPVSRTLTADEQSFANAILELTFMNNPSTIL